MKCARSNDLAALVIFPQTNDLSAGVCASEYEFVQSADPPDTTPMSFAAIMPSKRMQWFHLLWNLTSSKLELCLGRQIWSAQSLSWFHINAA
jgi:hypothetical protein